MKLKTIYLVLCLLGAVLPYWQFVPWVAQNGPNMPLFFHQLFANHSGLFSAWMYSSPPRCCLSSSSVKVHGLGCMGGGCR